MKAATHCSRVHQTGLHSQLLHHNGRTRERTDRQHDTGTHWQYKAILARPSLTNRTRNIHNIHSLD